MSDDARSSPANRSVPPRERTPPWMDHEPGAKDTAFTPEMGELTLRG